MLNSPSSYDRGLEERELNNGNMIGVTSLIFVKRVMLAKLKAYGVERPGVSSIKKLHL